MGKTKKTKKQNADKESLPTTAKEKTVGVNGSGGIFGTLER